MPNIGDFLNPLAPIIDLAKEAISLIPDPNERARLAAAQVQAEQAAQQQISLAQIAVDQVEAASPSLLVSGGRPAFIWLGVIIMAWNYILAPTINFLSHVFGGPAAPQMLIFDAGEVMAIVTGVLGLGVMRSFDKSQGVAEDQSPASRHAAIVTKLKPPIPLVVR